jgi:Na+-transporting methylmalonyl-CoA/oxaloacetate decarboxylase beta subunit
MNHTNITIVAMLVATAAALIGAVGVNIGIQTAAAQNNPIDIENSETNFIFKHKLKNNCSGFADCTNTSTERLTPPA